MIHDFDPKTFEELRAAGPVAVRSMPAELYHGHRALGASAAETFRENQTEFYYTEWSREFDRKPSTPAMRLGELIHLLLLQPKLVSKLVAPTMPELGPDGKKWDKRRKLHKEAWAEEEAKREGLLIYSREERDRADATAFAVRTHAEAASALSYGEGEVSIFWTDGPSGIDCKCRVDWLNPDLPIDLKTTRNASPRAWAKQANDLGYHRKAAHYRAGLKAWSGDYLPLAHIAAESDWPHRVGFFELVDLDDESIRLGETQRRETLTKIAACIKSGDWREDWERGVTEVHLPRYAVYENEYQTEAVA